MGSPWAHHGVSDQEWYYVAVSTRLGSREGHLTANLCTQRIKSEPMPHPAGGWCSLLRFKSQSLTFPHCLTTHPF